MGIKFAIIILSVLGVFFLIVIPVLAEEVDEPPLPPKLPGRIEETGTVFEITDSEYLNISLESTEEIKIVLESVPKTISLHIEASSVSASTVLTFSNLEPNTTYYKFTDSYKNKVILTTNSNGSYTFTQDLTQHYHIWFQPENDGTVYLPADCTDYGTWDEPTSTCTLTQDIFESVEIVEDNITLDCNNHEITTFYYGYGYGIYLSGRQGLTIENCTVTNFYTGIYLAYSSDNTIINNSFSGNYYPIWVRSSYPQFSGNQLQNNGLDGIILSDMELNRDYTLTGAPVFINYDYSYDSIIVLQGYTLTIEPGTIIKSVYSTSGLRIDGTLIAEGTENEPIVFTTLYDDDYGGDTNNDGEETQGNAGFWGQIVFTSTSTNSSLNHIIVRYGGRRWTGAPYYSAEDYVLKISGSNLTLANSMIEDNTFGVLLTNSNSQITKTIFKDHQYSRPFWWHTSTGLSLVFSNAQIKESTFQNNRRGIYAQGGQPVIENNVFSGNNHPIWVNNSYPQFSGNQIEGNGLDGVVLKGMILNQDYTLGGGPVFVNHESLPSWGMIVPEGRTLTIEPGTIIKFVGTSALTIEGTLIAEGTTENPIVFTSLQDDEYGGDTNRDGDATQGSAGQWGQIIFTSTSTNSSLKHVIIRYGGRKWAGAPHGFRSDYVLKIEGSDLTLADSIIENNAFGFHIENSNSSITNTTFRDHQYSEPFWHRTSTGLSLVSSNPQIKGSTFQNNRRGIYMAGGEPIIEDNVFSGNSQPIWVENSYPQFLGNQIEDNYSDGIVLKNTVLNRDYTLKANYPFINPNRHADGIIVPEGYTLTLAPGTIIKTIPSTGGLRIDGILIAEGTVEKPIVFTTIYDDEYGGDTNGDGDATQGGAGRWGRIVFTPTSINSSLKHTIIRYRGREWAGAPHGSRPDYVLRIEGSDLTLTDSVVEDNISGFYMENSNSPIARTIFRDHQYSRPFSSFVSTALHLVSSNPTIDSSIFSNNKRGIDVESGSAFIRDSSIYDSTDYGVYNRGPEIVDAKQNWWGDPTGPYHPTLNPDGQGDRVSDRVDFDDWLGYDPTKVKVIDVAVILAEPKYKSFDPSHDKAYFEGIKDQVKDYYCENAFGKWDSDAKICDGGVFNLEFEIFDNNGLNYKLPQTQKYYGEDFPQAQEISLGLDGNGRELKIEKTKDKTALFIWDAINKADDDIDYNAYQSVITIYPDYSQQLKPRQKEFFRTLEFSFDDFQPAPINSPTEFINNWISISENETKYAWAHEIGHALGNILTDAPLEDLYPVKASRSYGGNVVDYFDVMGRRTPLWGLIKDTVSYFSSFTKIKLGWLKEKIVGYGNYTIESLETMKFDDEVIRYNISPDSYYLLEARTNNSQYSRWDRDVPENDPLVVYKVSSKEVPVNGRTVIMDFVNVKAIGTYFLNPFPLLDPFDVPYKDPDNKVLIEINNRVAEPDSFKINAKISEYSLLKYIGIILRPKLGLLGKMWQFAPAPREVITGIERGPGEEQYLHIFGYKIKQISEFPAIPYFSSIQKLLCYLLIPFILVLFFLMLCIKKKALRKIILWTIISLAIIFIIIRFFVSFAAASGLGDLAVSQGVSYGPVAADLDLHAYDDQGRHVGINYETSEYENQIPGAETSGDLVYDDEWIFVPEGTNVQFLVNSKDIEEMLETYPELQELTDGIEDYEVQAVYYDEISQRYESNVVTEDISPGTELAHQVIGTHDITIGPGALVAKVDFNPDTLNLRSKGKWVTVYIELPENYDPNLIDLNSVLLNNQVPAETNPKYEFVTDPDSYLVDSNDNGILERMVKFDQSAVQDILEVGDEVEITIIGEILEGSSFQGSDTIKVITKGKEVATILTAVLLACGAMLGLFVRRRQGSNLVNHIIKTVKQINHFKRK